jgi:hypothetical protein
MNDPARVDQIASAANLTRQVLSLEELLEQLGLVAVYARIAQQLVEVGDAAGRDYAMRRMGAHARAAIVARNHLVGKEDEAENG